MVLRVKGRNSSKSIHIYSVHIAKEHTVSWGE